MKTMRLIIAFYTMVFLGGGLFLIAVSCDLFFNYRAMIQQLTIYLTPDRLLIGGIILFGAGLLPVILKVIELRRSRYVAFDNPEGEVAIALNTIEEFINRVGRDAEGVIELKPSINPRKRAGVEIILEVILEEGVNIPQLTEMIQHRVKTQVQELLGIENIGAIQINVVQIKPRTEIETT